MTTVTGADSELSGASMFVTTAPWWPYQFRVSSADPELLRWVHQHLACTVTAVPIPPGTPEITISAAADPGEARRLSSTGQDPDSTVEGFPGTWWDVAPTADGMVWRHGADDHLVVITRTGPQRWTVTAAQFQAAALTTLRVIRELVRARLVDLGGMPVHGSLAAGAGLPGTLLVGPSGAGKTTLALSMARRRGWVVSTDQTTLVPAAGDQLLGVGSPVAHRVGAGATHALSPWPSLLDAPVLRRDSRSPGLSATKAWLTGAEADVLLGVSSAPAAPLDRVVLLRRHDNLDAQRSGWHRPATAHAVRAEFRDVDPAAAGFWLTGPATDPAPGRDRLDQLVRRLPLTVLSWDPTRHPVELALDRLRATA